MRIFSLIFLFVLYGCQNETVQLPTAPISVVSEIVDHSPIYLFYELKDDKPSAVLNDKNRIGTTNWVFHIDKRLPLKEVIPYVVQLQNKKTSGMHTNEKAQNYFTYMDDIQKTLAFMPFTEVNFAFDDYYSSQYVKDNPDYHLHFEVITLRFSEQNVMINGNEVADEEMFSFIEDYILTAAPQKRILLYLNFNQETTFGRYLNRIIALEAFKSDLITVAPTHFIYDVKKLEDCGCM
jgi:hypothetical protein